ncbi:UNVERIFIED_CONTAM: hypothetical protein K2H54_040754 [Gekko kuhli]
MNNLDSAGDCCADFSDIIMRMQCHPKKDCACHSSANLWKKKHTRTQKKKEKRKPRQESRNFYSWFLLSKSPEIYWKKEVAFLQSVLLFRRKTSPQITGSGVITG